MKKENKKTQKYDIQDFEARGTLQEIAESLRSLAFDIDNAEEDEVDKNNENEQSFFDDGKVSCTLFPLA